MQVNLDNIKEGSSKKNNILNLTKDYDQDNYDDYLISKKYKNFKQTSTESDPFIGPQERNGNKEPECSCPNKKRPFNDIVKNIHDGKGPEFNEQNSFQNMSYPKRSLISKDELNVRKMIDYTINPIIKQSIACFSEKIVEGFKQIQEENKQFFNQILTKLSIQSDLKPDIKTSKKRDTNQIETQTSEETPRKKKKIEGTSVEKNTSQQSNSSNNYFSPKNGIIKLIGEENMKNGNEMKNSNNSNQSNEKKNNNPQNPLFPKYNESFKSPQENKLFPKKDPETPNSVLKETKKEDNSNIFINSSID